MNIKDILSLPNVIDVRAADKMKVLQELCRRASTAVALPVEFVTREVLKREELGSTGVGRRSCHSPRAVGEHCEALWHFGQASQPD